MPLYFIKPVVWNDKNYKQPGGAKFTSGYPKEFGFGHEEWNNADSSRIQEDGNFKQIFHTQAFGNQPLDEYAGDIFIFMIASHRGGQYLVGVAGEATSLFADQHKEDRIKYSKLIDVGKRRWQETWKLGSVKKCFDNDLSTFRKKWSEEVQWTPTWICPSELFCWLNEPLLLDPIKLTGKTRLVTMFNSFQEISNDIASTIIASIPVTNDATPLQNLKARLQYGDTDLATDINTIENDNKLNATSREALVQARLGQGKFRQDLMSIWGGACAVSGCTTTEVLRASHIIPWRDSTNRQKLDPNNGLLLSANLDALFDRGLISFVDTGEMIISNSIPKNEREMLGLMGKLRVTPNAKLCSYLEQHRKIFK